MRILIIEDAAALSGSMLTYLQQNKFYCELATDFDHAVEKLGIGEYACIVLDISLPGGSGLQILQQLKRERRADGVLIISAKNSLDDKIHGLALGADDYLTKPFHLAELSARINAIIRRRNFDGNNHIQCGRLHIDINYKMVATDEGVVELTRKEFDLLIYLISNKSRVVTKESMIDHLWGEETGLSDNYDFIYAQVKNLRKKLAEHGCADYIRAVYGVGYKFIIPDEAAAV